MDVWDLCCDHGLLGRAAWESGDHPHVHLVDQVPAILRSLRAKWAPEENFHLHLSDAAALSQPLTGTVVIAGVGAQKILGILSPLRENGLLRARRFVLSPQKDEGDFAEKIEALFPLWKSRETRWITEGRRRRPIFVWDADDMPGAARD